MWVRAVDVLFCSLILNSPCNSLASFPDLHPSFFSLTTGLVNLYFKQAPNSGMGFLPSALTIIYPLVDAKALVCRDGVEYTSVDVNDVEKVAYQFNDTGREEGEREGGKGGKGWREGGREGGG